jgi:protein-S-isoprenylcysteine O-methyltransferase Ste14
MLELGIVGPILTLLAALNVALHLKLDIQKISRRESSRFGEPSTELSRFIIGSVAFSTILLFIIVGMISLAWLWFGLEWMNALVIVLLDPSLSVWISGLFLLVIGIILHAWSRYIRQEMVSSWVMNRDYKLIVTGPYSRIRHPSYASYILSFIGISLLLPSVFTMLTLMGIPGYYSIALQEEKMLISQFGDEYIQYMQKTGRFIPRSIST